jgi:hypothetical protein
MESSGSGSREPRLTAVGIRCADHATPSMRKEVGTNFAYKRLSLDTTLWMIQNDAIFPLNITSPTLKSITTNKPISISQEPLLWINLHEILRITYMYFHLWEYIESKCSCEIFSFSIWKRWGILSTSVTRTYLLFNVWFAPELRKRMIWRRTTS